jgi:fluoride exporter
MMNILIIGIGGFIGAILRYIISGFFYDLYGDKFPYGTLAVNIIGCFALGFFITMAEGKFIISPQMRSFAAIGLLGAFTTFSTFSFETLALIQNQLYTSALLNILISILVSIFAVWAGIILARLF